MNTIFYENIEKSILENKNYRKVVYTSKFMQFVYMNIKPLDSIPMEIHNNHDQFIRIESGEGKAIVNNNKYKLYDGIGIIIPAGAKHQIINTSSFDELKLYTIYSPPEHPANLIQSVNPNYYKEKYLKYKEKYLKSKYLINNNDITNPIKESDFCSFILPLANDSTKISKEEPEIYDLEIKCKNDIIPTLAYNSHRITLFNVHNFISVCSDISDNMGRNINKFSNFLNNTASDLLFLTDVVPDYTNLANKIQLNPKIDKIKLKDDILKSNHVKLICNLSTFNYKIITRTPNKTHYLANCIFSKFNLSNTEIHDIGHGKCVIESTINILPNIQIILLLAHFTDDKIGYDINVIKTINIILKSKQKSKYIIFGGDLNFPIREFKHTSTSTRLQDSKIFETDQKNINLLQKIEDELIYLKPDGCDFTNLTKEQITDMFFVSKDFVYDFDIIINIVKSNLSNHYPVLLDFKYIDTKIKMIDSHFKLLFNGILNRTILKNFSENNLYYCNNDVKGYLDYSNQKYRFTHNCIKLIKKGEYLINNHTNINANINQNITIQKFKIILNDFYKNLLSNKLHYIPLINFFIMIITNKKTYLTNCFESVCTLISNPKNFTYDEICKLKLFVEKKDIKKDDSEYKNAEEIFFKYYNVTHNTESSHISIFGFNIINIYYVDSIDKSEYTKIYYSKYSSTKNINIIKPKYDIKKYMMDDLSCIYNSAKLCEKITTDSTLIADNYHFYDDIKSDINQDDLKKMQSYTNGLSTDIKKLFYKYTDKFSNMTQVLTNEQDEKWIFYTDKGNKVLNKDNYELYDINEQGNPIKVREVTQIFNNIISRAPEINSDFHVYRATTILNLYNVGINIFNNIYPDINIKYFQSTTGSPYTGILGDYTLILFPTVIKICIPKGKNNVILLGGELGLPGQFEVLLNNNCKLKFIKKYYSNIPLDNGNSNIYGLILEYKYEKL